MTQHKTSPRPSPSARAARTPATRPASSASRRARGGAAGEAIFALTLTQPTAVTLDTIGSAFDMTLYVRTGACKAGRELACDDDSGGTRNAKLTFSILYPGTYYIFVDGFTVDLSLGPDQARTCST
ncbi:MAG: PPC domain-containing protein [Polyangiaceae bacterium]